MDIEVNMIRKIAKLNNWSSNRILKTNQGFIWILDNEVLLDKIKLPQGVDILSGYNSIVTGINKFIQWENKYKVYILDEASIIEKYSIEIFRQIIRI